MLKTKYLFISNVSSNLINYSSNSVVQDTLFELMKNNVLIVDNNQELSKQETNYNKDNM